MIVRRPLFYLILITAALFIAIPVRTNNVPLREDLLLVAVAIILAHSTAMILS